LCGDALPIPPSKELIYFFMFIYVFKQVEDAVIKCLGVGDRIGA
jgi:hypothetical protein